MKRSSKIRSLQMSSLWTSSRGATRQDVLRRGATLTEVLMSLLIMSVGVISVFSLYPIAVLRSIQATQLTHSKILLGNAEAEILGDPALINGAPPWRPNVLYRAGDIIVAPTNPGSTLTAEASLKFVCTQAGTSGSNAPDLASISAANRNYANNGTAIGATPPGAVLEDTDAIPGFSANDLVWQRAVDDVQTVSGLPPAPTRSLEFPAGATRTVTVIDPLGWARHHGTSLFGLRDNYGTAPRLDGGLRGLADDGVAGGRTMGFLSGSSLSVEATFRSLFGFRAAPPAGSKGFFTWDGSAGVAGVNEELSSAQLLSWARLRTQLPDDYESSIEPLTNVSVTTAAGGPTTIIFPPLPESTAILQELQSTVEALELAGQSRLARVRFETVSGRASVARWIVSGFDTDSDGVIDVDAIDPAGLTLLVAPVEPTDFNAPPSTAARPILLTPTDLTGGAATPNGQILIKSVRIELNESRYSWLATVTRDSNGGLLGADCVVFFRREFEPGIEVGFHAQIGNDPGDVDDDPEGGSFDPVIAATNRRRAYIYTGRDASAPFDGATDTLPEIAVGRELFDSVNGIWYTITSVVTAAAADGISVVELDRDAEVILRDTIAPVALGPSPTAVDPQVVIPRGVVRIFPMDLTR